MNPKFVKKTITALIVSILLSYVLINTNDKLTIIVVIPFLMFAISMFIKNICLILKKNKLAKIFDKIMVISFFVYYFGFLIYWDYVSLINKDYVALICSLIAWAGGIFIAHRRYLRFKEK